MTENETYETKEMTETERRELGKTLWNIADKLRGAMDADDFRDYMLAFLFMRYLSDNYQKVAKKLLGEDYPEAKGKKTPLQVFYDENAREVKDFEDEMYRNLHYVILPNHLWENIAELARTQSEGLLATLDDAFKYIEKRSFDSALEGMFDEINLGSDKLGKGYGERNKKLHAIITAIVEGLAEFSADSDSLGDAYEYLIGQFASGAGKRAGEFYTPQTISTILSRIVALDNDPAKGPRKHLEKVLDFACGSGSLLLNVRRQMKGKIGKIYGQEKNITTYNLARMNMLLHGVKDSAFDIFHGDTLTNDWPEFKTATKSLGFDAVVANPPFSYRWDPTEDLRGDPRFGAHGLAPRSAADFAFLLHGFHHLADDGTMAIILPHGVLFRGGAEGDIRKKMLEDKNIDTVISLPANLFYSTGIPVCILVLKKCCRNDDILFINAAEHFEKGKRQNFLTEEHIKKIVQTYEKREEVTGFSRRVPMAEITDNEHNLNISRYVSTAKEEQPVDLYEVHKNLVAINKRIEDARRRHNVFLKELGLPELP